MDEVKRCGLHSMVLACCRLKAQEKLSLPSLSGSLSLHPKVNANDFLLKNPVGSLLYFSEPAIPIHLEPDFSAEFNLLRVLEPKFTKFQGFPLNITKLIYLRYLTLSIDDVGVSVSVIPEAISKLWNLQTLVVDTNAPSITMKANIWRMVKLRHLKTKDEINFKPESATAHHNLQTITTLSPDSCNPLLSKMAHKLRTLGIRGKLHAFFQTMSLGELHHLENLKLENDLRERPPEAALPQLNCFPKYLKRLTLSNTFLHWKHISTLAKIETLEVLKLKHNAFTGDSWTADGEGFKSLQFLLIVHTDLVRWDISSGYLPTLRVLVLNNCEKLTVIPLGLARYLQLLEIDFVGKSVVDCANRIDEAIKQELNHKKILRWGSPLHLKIGPGCF